MKILKRSREVSIVIQIQTQKGMMPACRLLAVSRVVVQLNEIVSRTTLYLSPE